MQDLFKMYSSAMADSITVELSPIKPLKKEFLQDPISIWFAYL